MKIAFASSLSNSHTIFMDHYIKSILKHNSKFKTDWIIFCREGETVHKYDLTKKNKEHLLKLYPNFKFHYIDVDKYAKYNKEEVIYYSIELFSLRNYDRVIFHGADMLCFKPLDKLFEYAEAIEGIAMAREMRRGCWNNGSMIVGKKYLTDKVYNDLLTMDHKNIRYKKYYGHDQKIYNIYFAGAGANHTIKKVHQKFNTLVSEIDFISWSEIVLMHYFYKPTVDASRRHLTQKQIDLWEEYDNPEGRYKEIDG